MPLFTLGPPRRRDPRTTSKQRRNGRIRRQRQGLDRGLGAGVRLLRGHEPRRAVVCLQGAPSAEGRGRRWAGQHDAAGL
jgi:hypothetical protein